MGESRYIWDERSMRYRDTGTGRFISRDTVRLSLEAGIDNSTKRIDTLTESLRSGTITLDRWTADMAREIKSAHLASVALERGGWDQMRPADYGRAGAMIRRQYGFLERFAGDIASGRQPLNGQATRRAQMYIDAAIETYHLAERASMIARGFDRERSVLDPRVQHHCRGCLDEAKKGWQPIGDMVPIGRRNCVTNDRCFVQYQNSRTGEVMGSRFDQRRNKKAA